MGLTDDMRQLCRITSCRREFLCSHFGFEVDRGENPADHMCCDVCEKKAMEEEHKDQEDYKELVDEAMTDIVDINLKTALQNALKDLISHMYHNQTPYSHLKVKLPEGCFETIIANCFSLKSHKDILELYPTLLEKDAQNIFLVVQAVVQAHKM